MKCPRCDVEMIDANGFGIFVCNNCGDSADVSILELIDSYKEELRKTKHALWIARALRANEQACFIEKMSTANMTTFFYSPCIDNWRSIAQKCLRKAEEYE